MLCKGASLSYDADMRRLILLVLLFATAVALPTGATVHTDLAMPRLVDAENEADSALPNAVISSLAEDHDGFLWIGTARGVVRFDGKQFHPYADRWSASFGETALFVRSLLVGRDGTLWIGTDFAGLARYDLAQDRLVQVALGDDEQARWSITAMVEDARGGLWIGTDGMGLLRRDPSGQVQRMRRGDGVGLPDDRITSVMLDHDGELWVGTWSGLVSLPADAVVFAAPREGLLAQSAVTALLETADGELWAGGMGGSVWRRARGRDADWSGLGGTRRAAVHALLQPDPGSVWIGRADGVEIRDAGSGELRQRLQHQAGNPHSLASDEIRALLLDRGGQVWIGSYGGGLQRYNPFNVAFTMLDRHAFAAAGPSFDDPNTRAILARRDGSVLLGTQARGVLELDAALAPLDVLRDEDGEPAFQGVRVTGLAESRDGALWIGSDAGVFHRPANSRRLEPIRWEGGVIRSMLAAADGGVWIGTEDGLWLVGADGAAERVIDQQGRELRRSVNAIQVDQAGHVWVGGEFGLGRIPMQGGRLQRIEARHPGRGGNTDVLGILLDAEGTVWFDTPSGLYRLHPGDAGEGLVDAISLAHGIAGQAFGANLLQDRQGRVWTQDNVLDPMSGKLLRLGPADGITIGSPWFRAYAGTDDGRLLFGGVEGVVVVRPDVYRIPDYDAPLVLTALRVDGSDLPPGSHSAGIELEPGQHRLELEFAALDFAAAAQVRYRYRLTGESDAWSSVSADHRLATFANLAPGDYRFELTASDRHGRVDARRLVLPVVVHPAWWQRWWVRLLGLSALALMVFLLMQQRTRWLRARQHELERNVASRTRELEDVSAALLEKSRALELASRTDPLTGLRNRRHFSAHVDTHVAPLLQRIDAARQQGQPEAMSGMVFFLFDIDHFKRVNDQYGHSAGDAILQQFAERLRTHVPADADLVRWGGEEFLVLVHGLKPAQAPAIAERVLQGIDGEAFLLPDQRLLRCTCSLGFAAFPLQARYPHQTDWNQVLELADRALYAAKSAGRNGWVGIFADEAEPLSPDPERHVAEELAAGRLRIETSLPAVRVREALATPGN